jgi:hypothetical protein
MYQAPTTASMKMTVSGILRRVVWLKYSTFRRYLLPPLSGDRSVYTTLHGAVSQKAVTFTLAAGTTCNVRVAPLATF